MNFQNVPLSLKELLKLLISLFLFFVYVVKTEKRQTDICFTCTPKENHRADQSKRFGNKKQ